MNEKLTAHPLIRLPLIRSPLTVKSIRRHGRIRDFDRFVIFGIKQTRFVLFPRERIKGHSPRCIAP